MSEWTEWNFDIAPSISAQRSPVYNQPVSKWGKIASLHPDQDKFTEHDRSLDSGGGAAFSVTTLNMSDVMQPVYEGHHSSHRGSSVISDPSDVAEKEANWDC